jgi:enoyl-CoA hydratase
VVFGTRTQRKDYPVTTTLELKRTTMAMTGGVAVATLASDKVNSLDPEVLRELRDIIDACEANPEIEALVLTGEGKVFSAGLNVTEVLANEISYSEELLSSLHQTLVRIFTCPLPTVVAINGAAIAGGCLLACAFDRRLIAEGARIGVTELKVGVSFPTVAVELLKYVSGSRAEQLMVEARLLPADEACQVGLVHQTAPLDELLATAIASAGELAALDTRAYALAKESARRGTLGAVDNEGGQLLDQRVREQWQDDATRANLATLLKPKG